ncbi:NAD(P)-dependent oxidoreductase [Anaerocolumna xylanovorans]|uniref:D-lactate dehydrogenase n=1 Tax=Anaerocolumna xylanovorans DSM 12503 TaxID=1121345 RepID=A0A1M7Y432_9FIRM|nr:NAD(P)-dependent oxidoreductase [Anaerocolumna xylanovorans]SHO46971.1 D-lactate dehydrogenase [Anaerocolumna xylanovorans DSM 12503]
MKVLVFQANEEEMDYIYECNRRFGFELVFADFDFNTAGADVFRGFDALWITTSCKVTPKKAEELKSAGVCYLASRAAGTDHMDGKAMERAGIRGANVPKYSPNAIAEHTICLVLMLLRHMKRELFMIERYDFTLNGLRGRELRNMTVGVIGTGRIGAGTIQVLKGFGCRIIAHDLYQNEEVKDSAAYTDLQEVLASSDIIILHCPLTEKSEKLINRDTIGTMKDGVLLVNTARGGLMDYEAVLAGLTNGKIGGAAFDVYDRETPYIRRKAEKDTFEDETLRELLGRENVIYTAHMSFYTDTAIENMILTTFENLKEYEETGRCSNDIYE